MEPRFGRGKWEGIMIDLRGRVIDNIKVLQDELSAIICPLADQACLDAV